LLPYPVFIDFIHTVRIYFFSVVHRDHRHNIHCTKPFTAAKLLAMDYIISVCPAGNFELNTPLSCGTLPIVGLLLTHDCFYKMYVGICWI